MKKVICLIISLFITVPSYAAEPIKIGVICSNTTGAAFCEPHNQAINLAASQMNDAGGILGRKIEILLRDDKGDPGEAARTAEELITRDHVDFLLGAYYSHIGMAVSSVAQQHKIPFITTGTSTDKLLWDNGHPYVARTFPSTYTQAGILSDLVKAQPIKKWAIIAGNYEWGHTLVEEIKKNLADRPDIQIVDEEWPAINKLEAGPTVQAIANANPEGLLVCILGSDLYAFVREGQRRDLFSKLTVIGEHTGFPEFLRPMAAYAPEDWIVTGYNPKQFDLPAHQQFEQDFERATGNEPTYTALNGYVAMELIKAAVMKSKTTEPDSFMAAFKSLRDVDTAWGKMSVREDGQVLTGMWVGKLKKDSTGKVNMENINYYSVANYPKKGN